ncbi:MAG: hypothetical protein JWQ98_1411 [Chlorobi bacterium]|nr:hypothetical protein [Chlorobiota bacterium]
MMDEHFVPMSFGEIFGMGWRLTFRTLRTAGLLLVLIYLPVMLMMGLSLHNLFATLGTLDITRSRFADSPDFNALVMNLMGTFLLLIPLIIILQLAIPYSQCVTVMAGWEEANGRDMGLGEMLRRSLKRPFWHILLQGLIVSAIAGMAMPVCMMILALISAVLRQVSGVFAVLVIFLGGLAMMVALIYFAVAIGLGKQEVVAEDRGPWKGLIASIALVRPYWFRAFGVGLVLGIILMFLYMIFSIPAAIHFAGFVADLGQVDRNDPRVAREIFSHMGSLISPWLFLPIGLMGVFMTLFSTNVSTALYIDLRARRGDFSDGDDFDLHIGVE